MDQEVQYINENTDPLLNLKIALTGDASKVQPDIPDSEMVKILATLRNVESLEHHVILQKTILSVLQKSILDKSEHLHILKEAIHTVESSHFVHEEVQTDLIGSHFVHEEV